MKFIKNYFNKGIGSLEILIGAAIIVTGILALIVAFNSFFSFALANDKNVQSAYLAEEGLEVMTFLRDGSYSKNIAPLSTSIPYYLVWNNATSWNGGVSSWEITTTPQYVDGVFLRQINISNVYRGESGNIVASDGTLDPNTRLVTVTLQYFQGHATTTETMSTYLTNFYNN